MKIPIFLPLFFYFTLINSGYTQKLRPEQATLELNRALIHKENKVLSNLLDNKLTYGHSNHWIESKSNLLQNNTQSYLIYKNITCDTIHSYYRGKTCIIRYKGIFEGSLDSKDFKLNLSVVQVWVKRNRSWKLLARQGVKIT